MQGQAISHLTDLRVRFESEPLEARAGDLVFGNRLSWTQWLLAAAGDQWTHVALVVEIDGELATVELGLTQGCFSRPLEEFFGAYRMVGVARPAMSAGCTEQVCAAALRALDDERVAYSRRDGVLLFAVAFVRRCSPLRLEAAVSAGARRLAARWGSRIAEVDAATTPLRMMCSGFVLWCSQQACSACAAALCWPARAVVRPWRRRPTSTDVEAIHRGWRGEVSSADYTLATPADVWVAHGFEFKAVRRPRGSVLLSDLATAPVRCGRFEQTHWREEAA